jgi:hypothetical protein
MPSSGFSVVIAASDRASAVIDGVNRRLAAMRAPVDRIKKSLTKFADVSGLNAIGKSFSSIGRTATDAFRSVARVVEPLAAITGALSLAGMVKMVQAWGDFGSQLGFAAQRMGIAAGQLQALQGAATLAGSSSSSLTSGLQNLGQTMYDAVGGRAPESVALFNQLGVAFDDGTRHARKVTDVLPQLADKIAALKDPYTQARVATALFGGAAEDLLPFLRKGAAGIAEYTAKARAYGVFNEAGIAGANKMRESWAGMQLAVVGLSNSISEKLAPIITPMLDYMSNWIAVNREWLATKIGDAVRDFAAWIKGIDFNGIITGAETFAHDANSVAQALGGWKNVVEGIIALKLLGWTMALLGPLASLLRLLGAVPAAYAAARAASNATFVTGLKARLAGGGAMAAGGGVAAAAVPVAVGAAAIGTGLVLGNQAKAFDKHHPWARRLDDWTEGLFGNKKHTSAADGPAASQPTLTQPVAPPPPPPAYGAAPSWPHAANDNPMTSAWKRNNPGNLRSWGSIPQQGGYAAFPTLQAGANAMRDNLSAYETKHGIDTIDGIVDRYAPQGDGANNPAIYKKHLEDWTGFKHDQHLDQAHNPAHMAALMRAMSRQEQHQLDDRTVAASTGAPGVALAAAGGGTGSVAVDTHVRITDERTTSTSKAKSSGLASAAPPKVHTSPIYKAA